MLYFLYNFSQICMILNIMYGIWYTTVYSYPTLMRLVNNMGYVIYDSVNYLTYLQFILPNESELTENNVNTTTDNQLKKIEYEDKYKTDLLKYVDYLRKDQDMIDSDRWKYLRNNILMENTPLGNVFMYYDSVKDTFCYYSDRIIPYKYIDTVCRKYVIKFNCVSLYFDIKYGDNNTGVTNTTDNTSTNINEECKETLSGSGSSVSGVKNSIFVKLKSYNKADKSTSNTVKSPELNTSINRYTYEGKLMNFNMLQKPEKKKFSYLDFKKNVK